MTSRPSLDELNARRRREITARRREITGSSRRARDLPAPPAPHPLRLRTSDEVPEAPVRPRKGDAEALQHQQLAREALTEEERELLAAVEDALRRRADLRLRPEPGVSPPPLPGTPEERARVREKLSGVPAAPVPTRREAIARYYDQEHTAAAEAAFEDLGYVDIDTDLRDLI